MLRLNFQCIQSSSLKKRFFLKIVLAISLLLTSLAVMAKTNLAFEVQGIQGELLTNVQSSLITLQKSAGEQLKPNQVRAIYYQTNLTVRKALEPFGRFRAQVSSCLSRKANEWIISVKVIPGRVLLINQLSVQVAGVGRDNPEIRKFIANFPLKVGDEFLTPAYNKAKSDLFTTAKNQGYLRAYFRNKILIDLKRYQCRINIYLETGPVYYFGNVRFETQPYSDRFMRRMIALKPGQRYSSLRLLKLQQDMENSYYFRSAVLTPDFSNIENYRVPIRAYLYRPKAARYTLGVGYGTLTGARISGALSLRHIGNEGHHFESEFKLSSILMGLAATYYIPGRNPLTDQWMMGANYKRFLPKAGKSDSVTFTGGYSIKTDQLQSNLSLNMLFERFNIRPDPGHRAHMLYPSWMISYLHTDRINAPTWGHYASLTLRAASQDVLSTTSFAQALGKLKFLFTPFSFSRIVVRADVGYTTVHNLTVFPLSLRYFAGGINSIRGFADSSIGPGKYLEIASLEYQHRVVNNWYAAVFYDIGTATNHLQQRLNRGAGVGVVYNSLLGPIKVYLAQALSKKTKPYSVEFSVGPEFA